MRKVNLQLLMTFGMCFFSSVLAQDTTINAAPSAAASNAANECTKELLLSYFPQNFVKETLKKFNVPQDKWDSIAQALADRNKDVVKLVEDKAAQQNPNPLKDPALHQQAVAIFRDTLLQVFSDVAKANGVTDDEQIKKMFVDIQQQKAKRFVECRRQAEEAAGGKTNPNAKEEENDDDDDDEDDDDEDTDGVEPEKDGDDDEDADNDIKLPKPRGSRYDDRNQISNQDYIQKDGAQAHGQQEWEYNHNHQADQYQQNTQQQQQQQYYNAYPQ